jgi:hypothetical protein
MFENQAKTTDTFHRPTAYLSPRQQFQTLTIQLKL